MLMPFLSVTAIGLFVGAIGHLVRGGEHALLRGFFGAWAGFATGALIGLFLDIATNSGHWIPLLGHLLAVLASISSQRVDLAASEEGARRS